MDATDIINFSKEKSNYAQMKDSLMQSGYFEDLIKILLRDEVLS